MINNINCFLGLHEHIALIDDNRHTVHYCQKCKSYKVVYKLYNIKNKFKYEELPQSIISKMKHKSQA